MTPPASPRLLALAAVALSSLATPLAAQQRAARPATTTAREATPMQAELEMMQREQPFAAALDQFLDAAAAGDLARAEAMISDNLRSAAGPATVANVLRGQVLPFFAGRPARHGARTVAMTTDQFGSSGFVYYLYAARADGAEPQPFAAYVVRENDRIVVANVLVNHLVPGRHR